MWPPRAGRRGDQRRCLLGGGRVSTTGSRRPHVRVGKLARALHRRLDRVQERRPDAGALELADRVDRRPARRGDGLAELDRVDVLVAEELRRAEHRLDDELGRHLAREPEQDAGLDHRLGEQREVRGARAGDGGDRVHVRLGDADDPAEVGQALLGEREVLLAGVRAGADARRFPRARSTGRSASRGRPARAAGDARLDPRGRDRGGDREDGLLGREQRPDLAEQRLEVLRLRRRSRRARHRRRPRRSRASASIP